MKAGILTYHSTRNSGAVLQAYALQKVLTGLGIETEIIDYRCKRIEDVYKIKRISEIKSIKELIKWALTIKQNKKAQKKFDIFKTKELSLSKIYDKNNIASSNEIYDIFITGSDQVWNFNLNGDDYTYLLDFVNDDKIKLSYAASMGRSMLEEKYKGIMENELLRFDRLSVREYPLKEYIKTLTGIEPELVLDPTLLLSKNDYVFEENISVGCDKYIFVYTVAATPNIERAAKELSKQTGYKIIWGHMSYKKKKGVINKTDISPSEFVNYIKNAEYVLTSSFHGMAFSIIMEKQFFYDLDVKAQNNNSRLETLSQLLELQDRCLTEQTFEDLTKSYLDYNAINEKLNEYKKISMGFLDLRGLKDNDKK